MKKIFEILLAATVAMCLASACSESDRDHVLKVYNWSSYIDEALIPEFEQWYEECTGEPVRVIYSTFDINETMLAKIEKGHEDYDLCCPSDYIIERMLQQDLLLPISHDFGDTTDYIEANISPFVRHFFDLIDGKGKNANDYAVSFMWGTTGILYNEKYVDPEDARSWDIILNEKYKDRIFIKDAARDIYAPILARLRQDDLLSGRVTRDELMYDSSDESIAMVEQYMNRVRPLVAGWEADFGKEQMTQEKGWVNMTWSGDAVWAIEEAAEIGVPLNYVVPEEGSAVWFDGWVIPKYARNTKAASWFINFMCRSDNAIRNMDEIGYVSAVATDEVLEAVRDSSLSDSTVDVSYMFGEGHECEPLDNVQYPDRSVIERCSLEHDWGLETEKLLSMWARVKGNQLTPWTIFVICFALTFVAVWYVYKWIYRRARRKARARRYRQVKKSSPRK
ncbi:MAG: ABC transporter substrate-binding protein [Bacteroidales bacterium]|nr:ABC transporter substrate-binding protein [Bacteroidales bacterium]